MMNIFIGNGDLDGKGIYAARDFEQGEVILSYQLQELSREEFRALPQNEQRLFVHSYGGRRFLYPVPARYVNHSDNPNAYDGCDNRCSVALRPIRKGEPITIDARQETDRELATFMDVFEKTANAGEPDALAALIDDEAVLWLPSGACDGRDLFMQGLQRFRTSVGAVSFVDRRWMVGSHRWEAVCSCQVATAGEDHSANWHATMVLKVIEGNWQVIYAHIGGLYPAVL